MIIETNYQTIWRIWFRLADSPKIAAQKKYGDASAADKENITYSFNHLIFFFSFIPNNIRTMNGVLALNV